MSCDKFGRFSIDHTFSSPISRKCVLILSVDGFLFLTKFMYVMVSVTLSFIISVIIVSKINSVVIGNKVLVESLVDKYIMMEWWKIIIEIKSQLTAPCLKSPVDATEKVWNMFKSNNKNTRTTSMTSLWCFYCQLWTYIIPFSGVSIYDFEQVTVS